MKLYYTPGVCSLAPHIALKEAELVFETERVDLKRHETASGEDYYTINSKGYVPALRLANGNLLTEVAAILQFVADQVPSKALAPAAGSFERVRLQEWLGFIGAEIHKGFSPLWSRTASDEMKAVSKHRLFHWFDWLEPQLTEQAYLLGSQFSVADAYLYTCLNWSNFLHINLDKWPGLQAYLARVAARPAVQMALRAEGLLD
ncbi:glutathione transferase GstA [Chitinimonas sp. PSY-7]|uniref:glutathione transferase GstA n=1 Tax=Chitinimonas sp. PSY-7 TaxID=3459088 RepID=UPI0040403327